MQYDICYFLGMTFVTILVFQHTSVLVSAGSEAEAQSNF